MSPRSALRRPPLASVCVTQQICRLPEQSWFPARVSTTGPLHMELARYKLMTQLVPLHLIVKWASMQSPSRKVRFVWGEAREEKVCAPSYNSANTCRLVLSHRCGAGLNHARARRHRRASIRGVLVDVDTCSSGGAHGTPQRRGDSYKQNGGLHSAAHSTAASPLHAHGTPHIMHRWSLPNC